MYDLQETLVITGNFWNTQKKKKEFILPLHKRRGSYLTLVALIAQKTTKTVHTTFGQSEFPDKKERKLIK